MGQLPSTDCDRIRGYISESLDGELSEMEGVRLESHLGHCDACNAYAVDARRAAQLIRATPLESMDFPIVLPSRRLAVARRMQVVAAAAAVVLMVGLSAVVGSVGSRESGGLSAEAASASTGGLHSTEAELRMLYKASEHAGLTKHARYAL